MKLNSIYLYVFCFYIHIAEEQGQLVNYKLKISHDANFKNQHVIGYKDNYIISGSHKIFVSRNKREPWFLEVKCLRISYVCLKIACYSINKLTLAQKRLKRKKIFFIRQIILRFSGLKWKRWWMHNADYLWKT